MSRLAPRLAAHRLACAHHLQQLLPLALPPRSSFHFPSRKASAPVPSPVATSSDVTLDDFPLVPTSDPIIASLTYATDTELVDAILAEPPSLSPRGTGSSSSSAPTTRRKYVSPYNLDWKSSIDPAFAFLALRTRPTFSRFIEHIRPRVRLVYDALRASGMHQLFASDVLMRSGDIQVLRQLLEIDGQHRKQWRTSATVSIYSHIRPFVASGRLDPLSPSTLKAVASALIAEEETDLLPDVFDKMFETVPWTQAESWDLFAIILYMARVGQVDVALGMLNKLINSGRVPVSALGKSDPTHPEAKLLLIQSVIVRALLDYGLFGKVHIAANDLIATLEKSKSSHSTTELVLELCRTSIVGHQSDQVAWAGDFLLRFAHLADTPPLPSSIINTFIDASRTSAGIKFYTSLPPEHGPLSPKNIVRFANTGPKKAVLLKLLEDVYSLPPADFIAQRPVLISALVQAKERDAVMEIYDAWAGQVDLAPFLVISLVKVFGDTLTRRSTYASFIERVLDDYKKSSGDSVISDIVLARARLNLQQPDLARDAIVGLDRHDADAKQYIDTIIRQDPTDAYLLLRLLDPNEADAEADLLLPVEVLVSACVAGHWDALKRLKLDDRKDTRTLITILKAIKTGRISYALKRIEQKRNVGERISIDLYRVCVHRAAAQGQWDVAVRAWNEGWSGGALGLEEKAVLVKSGVGLLRTMRENLEDAQRQGDDGARLLYPVVASRPFEAFVSHLQDVDKSGVEVGDVEDDGLVGLVAAVQALGYGDDRRLDSSRTRVHA